MFGKLIKRLGYAFAAGLVVFAFLLLAQVNVDDLRLKLGHLLQPKDPTLRVGALHLIDKTGHVRAGRPPICVPSSDLVSAHFATEKGGVSVRNSLGYSMPAIARFSAMLFAPPAGLIGGSPEDSVSTNIMVKGHTFALDWVETTQLRSEDRMWRYIDALYEESRDCELVIERYWNVGQCVALVHRVSRAGGTMLGYTYNRHCMLPNVEDGNFARGPQVAPQPKQRITALLSRFKDYIGLISYQPGQLQAALNPNG